MKRFAYALAIAGLMVLGATMVTSARQRLPQWGFDVVPSDSGWVMTCTGGCAWKELGFSCPKGRACRMHIDQSGVRGVP